MRVWMQVNRKFFAMARSRMPKSSAKLLRVYVSDYSQDDPSAKIIFDTRCINPYVRGDIQWFYDIGEDELDRLSANDDSDGDQCPCTYHPVAMEERSSHLHACRAWPVPICGSCWAASCRCGFVFDSVDDSHSRWPNGRLRCSSCAP